ncbi:unnamed protein product [Wickerhamomyces anomalus]
MSIVSLLGINVINNPARFTDPYEFEITFECLEPLKDDLEWKLTYVVGPVPVGINKFLFTADPPSAELIPSNELVSVTVILLSCAYADREFVRVGYYVNNEYDSEELRENPPNKVQVEHVTRNILAEKPRVTRFNIVWDNEGDATEEFPPEQPDADLVEDDEEQYGQGENEGEEEEEEDEAAEEVDEEGNPVKSNSNEDREGTVEASDKKPEDDKQGDEKIVKKQKIDGEEVKKDEPKQEQTPVVEQQEEEEVKTPKDDENLLV